MEGHNCFLVPNLRDYSVHNNSSTINLNSVVSKFRTGKPRPFLEPEEFLANRQYGFGLRRPTGDLLVVTSQSWLTALDNKDKTHLISPGISEAFD